MFELNAKQEMALSIVWMRQDELPRDLTDLEITRHLLALRDSRMISMQTDMSNSMAYVEALCPSGREHYSRTRQARRKFKCISDSADELLNILCCDDNARAHQGPSYVRNRVEDYRELSRNGLLLVNWADNIPYTVAITDDGWNYFEGWFLDQEVPMNVNVSPVFNNNISSSPSSSSFSTSSSASSSDMTYSLAIKKLFELELDQEIRTASVGAIAELENSSKGDDGGDFLDKVERISNIAKNVSTLAPIVIPLIEIATRQFLGN